MDLADGGRRQRDRLPLGVELLRAAAPTPPGPCPRATSGGSGGVRDCNLQSSLAKAGVDEVGAGAEYLTQLDERGP